MTNSINKLKISSISVDSEIQQRIKMDQNTVEEYSDLIKQEKELPRPIVFEDGQVYWLTDGFHRLQAYRNCGKEEIDCEIIQGTKRDAILYAVGANSAHGLRRTNADKRKAVTTLLKDDEWGEWTSNAIAEKCGVSHTFVDNIRKSTCNGCKSETRIDKNGRELNTGNIGNNGKKKSEKKGQDTPSVYHKPEVNLESMFEEKDTNAEGNSSNKDDVDITKQAFSDLLQEGVRDLDNITDNNDLLKLIKSHSDKCNDLLNNTDKTNTDLPSSNTDIDMSEAW